MKRSSLILCVIGLSLSLTGCGLLGSVGRLGGSILKLPGSLLKSVTEAEAEQPAAQPSTTPNPVPELDESETAQIATAPIH